MPDFLKKIQNLPEKKKKIILFSIVGILALVLLVWWAKNIQNKIKNLNPEDIKKELQIPLIEEGLKKAPKFEMPTISEEQLKELEKAGKDLEEELEKEMEAETSTNITPN